MPYQSLSSLKVPLGFQTLSLAVQKPQGAEPRPLVSLGGWNKHPTCGCIPVSKWTTRYSGWWYTYPSEQYRSQLGWLFPTYGKIEKVPNHQPDTLVISYSHGKSPFLIGKPSISMGLLANIYIYIYIAYLQWGQWATWFLCRLSHWTHQRLITHPIWP